jgi:hypothetical protein
MGGVRARVAAASSCFSPIKKEKTPKAIVKQSIIYYYMFVRNEESQRKSQRKKERER